MLAIVLLGPSGQGFYDGASYSGGTDHICMTGMPIIAFEVPD